MSRLVLSPDDIKALRWVRWGEGRHRKARAVNPHDPTRTLHGQDIPDGAAQARYDTPRCEHSLRIIGEAAFRWRLGAEGVDVPKGDWPIRQLDVTAGATLEKVRGVYRLWWDGVLVLKVHPKKFEPSEGWALHQTETEFILWSLGRVCGRASRLKL